MMDLFETKFLYLDWDDRLKGKKGFVGTDIHSLRNMVNDTNGDLDNLTCLAKYKDDLPVEGNFGAFGIRWPVAYYDPNYTQKIAYARGRQIQCRHGEFEHWEDCDMPSWYEDYEYREKPEIWYVWKDLGDRIHVTLRQDMANAEIFLRGNRQECKDYAIEKFCKKCRREDSPCYIDECDGFEPSTEKHAASATTGKIRPPATPAGHAGRTGTTGPGRRQDDQPRACAVARGREHHYEI